MDNVNSVKPTEDYIPSSQLQLETSLTNKANGHTYKSSDSTRTSLQVTDATKAVFQEAPSLDSENSIITLQKQENGSDSVINASDREKMIAEVLNFINDKEQTLYALKAVMKSVITDFGFSPISDTTDHNLDQTAEEIVNKNHSELVEAATSSPAEFAHKFEESTGEIVRRVITKENYAKLNPGGTLIPLSDDEINDSIDKIVTSILDRIYAKYIPSYQPATTVGKDNEEKDVDHPQAEQLDKTHTVALMRASQHTPSTDKQFQVAIVVEVLGKLIIIENSILERIREERVAEKREQQLQDLIDRIKHDVIKREILTQEVKSIEVKLQDLKGRLTNFIEMPLDEIVKINQAYGKVNLEVDVNGKIRLRLPGVHKMKLASAA